MFRFRTMALSALLPVGILISGCHSAYINATVSNRGTTPISVVQVEYPSASFGTQTLAPGQDFHYRFKILGSGKMKITYTDTTGNDHKTIGPELKEGNEGSLNIVVIGTTVQWQSSLVAK